MARRWPEAGSLFPPSVIRTRSDGEAVKLVFGSCRISAPHEPPYTLSSEEDERGLGVDTLYATAMRLRDEPADNVPHVLVLLGDQIYAHKPPFDTLDFIRSCRDTSKPPGEEVASFEEYAQVYRDSWESRPFAGCSRPYPRPWSSTTTRSPTTGTSPRLGSKRRATTRGGTTRSPAATSLTGSTNTSATSPGGTGAGRPLREGQNRRRRGPILREFAYKAHRETAGTRWSFYRDFGNTRLVMMDSRGGR